MDTVWFVLPALLGTCGGALFFRVFTRNIKPLWILLAALYLALDTVVILHAPRLDHGQWNWSSKVASLLLGALTIAALQLSRAEVGIVMPRGRSAWAWTAVGIVGAVAFDGTLNYIFRTHHGPSLETILYQVTMPGLDEELTYRGVAFALIYRAFVTAGERYANAAAILIPSLVFGLLHAYSHSNGSSHFEWGGLFFSLPLGLLFAWVRLRSGSLLGGVLAHNLANITGAMVRGLR